MQWCGVFIHLYSNKEQRVSKKHYKKYLQLNSLFSMDMNYKLYREELAQADLPAVPYLGT